ncbi:alpha/beta-hydrolase [Lentithecium fluviatile CBS 122367]|uniref:Alpha/beta-hydrolase n=1 Tax=Lentithecium fluviatile CBS 122367 TaxID=1168545 RepID=A0A6G1IFJ6_9PLEO|nr:alpha/beta-hydrolase [Lentithecium fluviatile CBS 122367]
MAPYDDTTGETRFDSFHVFRTPFKKIGDHDIEVGILVPKDLKPGKHPLIVKFHGGGLVYGDCLFAKWIAAWFIPFIHRNNAITVLPNYRLTPEHTGNDILEDLTDFWAWFNGGGVEKFLASQNISAELDYDRVLASGDSAGGYMAIQLGLTRPKGEIKAVLAQYPMTTFARRKPDTAGLGGELPPPTSFIDEHMASVQPGAVISSAVPPARSNLSLALDAHGRFNDYFGTGRRLWPITAIEDAKHMPPTYIIHGEQDRAVVVGDTKAFVKKAEELLPGVEVRLDVRDDNRDHGFDIDMKEDEEPWLKESLKWVEERWLA